MDTGGSIWKGVHAGALFLVSCITIFLHWKLIEVAVIRNFFMTFARSLLAIISGGYVCTTFTNLFIVVFSIEFLDMESTKISFENINATLEFIMNFAKLFFFIDSYIGCYTKLFKKHPIRSFMFIFSCMTTFFIALVIPEFFARGFGANPPSHYISFGFTVINLLVNIYVYVAKKTEKEVTLGDANVKTRFQIEEARKTSQAMLMVTVFRFLVSGFWVVFSALDAYIHITPVAYHVTSAVFLTCRSVEAILFAVAFLFFHSSIVRYNDREAIREKYPEGLPEELTEEEKRLFTAPVQTMEESTTKQRTEWEKEYKYYKKNNRKQQEAPTISNEKLIPSFSLQSLD